MPHPHKIPELVQEAFTTLRAIRIYLTEFAPQEWCHTHAILERINTVLDLEDKRWEEYVNGRDE